MTSANVGEALRTHEPDILRDWEAHARAIPTLRRLSLADLRDSMPRLLDELAAACDAMEAGRRPHEMPEAAEDHAQHRLHEGADLRDVIAEYALLRESVLRVLRAAPLEEVAVVHRAIDQAIALSVERFTQARERTLRALDRISAAALASANLDELLHALLVALIETSPTMNTAAVFLRDGDALRLRAAAGFERESELGFTLRMGQGFAGTVAATGRPLFLRNASTDSLVRSAVLHRGVHALYGVPLVSEGKLIGVVTVGSLAAHDLSREDRRLVTVMAGRATAGIVQQLLNAALAAERARERAAREEAERASHLREDVLGIVSHDLKNPIGSVLLGASAAEVALERGELGRAREALRRVRRSALRMDALVHDILDAARIDAQRLPLALVDTEVRALVVEAVDAQALIAQQQGVELRYEVAMDARARCDAGRVGRVLANLIGNALKFTPRGGHVVVGARELGGEVELSVTDDGPGIDDRVLPHLFERFRRTAVADGGGVGLGLYISKGIVEAHGGRISAETTSGRGTTFRFTLRRA